MNESRVFGVIALALVAGLLNTVPVAAQQDLVKPVFSQEKALEGIKGEVMMVGDRWPGATLQRGILERLRSRTITRLRVLTTAGVVPSLKGLRQLGAEVRAFPSSGQGAVSFKGGGLIVTPGSVIKPGVGDVLVIGNPWSAKLVLAQFETYWAKARPVGIK